MTTSAVSALRHFEKHESVRLPNGIVVHYLYDAPYDKASGSGHNRSISGAVAEARERR